MYQLLPFKKYKEKTYSKKLKARVKGSVPNEYCFDRFVVADSCPFRGYKEQFEEEEDNPPLKLHQSSSSKKWL